ncbi:MAG: hypothetical protein GY925_20430 [Actinomycetia bacterium]|nr:hypothetical protein [Actinomycetes bacterium]
MTDDMKNQLWEWQADLDSAKGKMEALGVPMLANPLPGEAAARIAELETANERMRSVSGAMRTLRSHIADYDQTTYVPLAAALDRFNDAYPWDEGANNE